MEIRKFRYRGSLREVVVTEESFKSLKGFDISKMPEVDRKKWRIHCGSVDLTGKTDEEISAEYAQMKELMKYFRHFTKANILL